ncbi:tRNA (adenine(37)-N6)-methyltransferase [Vanessa cardui]|uniref:tRNA (adenine(37)-N6)-methyltransferase n=1 Tax=Vanessa cardui TaxID=171605 RepID=UPI001F13F5DB|nr:tRNA (adenine(37)-N6)-methyltransferase [Vanessa cardui]
MTENIEFYQNQIALARTEIKNLRQRISALKHEHLKEINNIKSTLSNLRCSNCAAEATSLVSIPNTDQASVSEAQSNEISFRPIGHIETSFANKRAVPRQPSVLTNSKGCIVIDTNVFNNPNHATTGLEEFSHLWIIFHFHIHDNVTVQSKVSPPRLGGKKCGVLASRSPHRPCPIGLSLVRLCHIEGNKIFFNGVDMVNGTPVLDIKPFIPQYDYPPANGDSPILTSLVRPPTEGTSDATETMVNLQLDDDSYSVRSVSPRLVQPIGIDTSSPHPRSPFGDIPSPIHEPSTLISPSPESPISEDLLDGPTRSPIRRVETERGSPDGQERFTPPQSATSLNVNQDGIRVASWVISPPSQRFQVVFTEDALQRLNDLIGDRAQSFKSNIENLLAEDPRSVYVRTRYPDHEYSCVLEDLSISCVFNDNSAMCTIIALRSAEELQN